MLSSSVYPVTPYISPSRLLPEITVKAFILSLILAIVMGAANAYLGLKIGLTISASIPAAVISMAILKMFRHSNILENNIVQTAASAGEVVASGVVFTLPALIMMGYWAHFPFWTVTFLVCIGGTMGVLFSIPLRRAFVVQSDLVFPEGVATGEVLKAGDGASKEGAKELLIGGIFSVIYKCGQSALMVIGEGFHWFTNVGRTVIGIDMGFSAVLVGAGYIVGLQVGLAVAIGGVLAWFVAVPLHGYFYGIPEGKTAYQAAVTIWNSHIRMVGVGTMVVGGLWTVVNLYGPIRDAIKSSIESLKKIRLGLGESILRTELDIPVTYVFLGLLGLLVPMFFVYDSVLSDNTLSLSTGMHYTIVTVATIFTLIVGFICAAVGAYMAGLVGSSTTPVSGVTMMAILLVAVLLHFLLKGEIDLGADQVAAKAIAAFTIILGSVVAIASAISGDNLQDLKSGQIVGSTPWKQQLMLIVGTVAGSLMMAPVLDVLFHAYGIGDVLPRPGMDPAQALAAPKAAIMEAVATGIFSNSFKWPMFLTGGAIAVVIIILDELLAKAKIGLRLPTLGIALGIYLPLTISLPLLVGGLIHHLMGKKLRAERKNSEQIDRQYNKGVLFCSGLIAGEALIGIFLAIPFAAYQSTDVFALHIEGFEPVATFIGAVSFVGICYYLYKVTTKPVA